MGYQDKRDTAQLVDRIIEEVAAWPHVTTEEHRFEGREFTLGPREVGHVHRWGIVDIPFTDSLRQAVTGKAEEHHVVPESGWTTMYIEDSDNVGRAVRLLKLSYLYHVTTLKRTPAGAEKFADSNVSEELDELGVSDEVYEKFRQYRETHDERG